MKKYSFPNSPELPSDVGGPDLMIDECKARGKAFNRFYVKIMGISVGDPKSVEVLITVRFRRGWRAGPGDINLGID